MSATLTCVRLWRSGGPNPALAPSTELIGEILLLVPLRTTHSIRCPLFSSCRGFSPVLLLNNLLAGSGREGATLRAKGSSLHLLLGADVTVVATLSLAAVGCLGGEASVALAADHLLALVGTGESSKRWLDLDATDATAAESEHQVQGRLLLNVVVRKSAAVLELLAGEDQTLLIGGNALLVLDLGPEIARSRGLAWRFREARVGRNEKGVSLT